MKLIVRLTAYAILCFLCLWLWLGGPEATTPVTTTPSKNREASPLGSVPHLKDSHGSIVASRSEARNEAFYDSDSVPGEDGQRRNRTWSTASVQQWARNLANAITNPDLASRRAGLEQAILIHTEFLSDPDADGGGQSPNFQEIERQMLEAAWEETDPMLIEDEFLPYLAAQPPEVSQPVLEHLLEKLLPGETKSAIVETLVDGNQWSKAQAWAWIQQAHLSEGDLSELMTSLQDAFPDGTFDNPPSSDQHVG